MEQLAKDWIEKATDRVSGFISRLPEYRSTRGISVVSGAPIVNILMVPTTSGGRKFKATLIREEDGSPVELSPDQALQFSEYILERLHGAYPEALFSMRRSHDRSIFIKYSDKEVVSNA